MCDGVAHDVTPASSAPSYLAEKLLAKEQQESVVD